MVFEIISIVEYSCLPLEKVSILFFNPAPNVCIYSIFITFLFLWTKEASDHATQPEEENKFLFIKKFIVISFSFLFLIWAVLFIIYLSFGRSKMITFNDASIKLIINCLVIVTAFITIIPFIYFAKTAKRIFQLSRKNYFQLDFNFKVFLSINLSIALAFQPLGILLSIIGQKYKNSIVCEGFDLAALIIDPLFGHLIYFFIILFAKKIVQMCNKDSTITNQELVTIEDQDSFYS
jgi:hypothetical protein